MGYKLVTTSGGELYHHGILGQKWGIRRYQNEDGTLTEAGKKKKNEFALYKSSTTKKLEADGYKGTKQYKASKELDKKIAERYAQTSMHTGKRALKNLLLGDVGMVSTYDMARAAGEGRVKAALRSVFDLNVSTLAAATVAGAANSRSMAKNGRVSTAGSIGAHFLGDTAGSLLKRSGSELSLQQRSIRNKYIREHS